MLSRFCATAALLVTFLLSTVSAAKSSPGYLSLEAGTGRMIPLSGRAANVFAADPKIAEVRPASATSLFVFGVAAGHTSIAAIDASGRAVGSYSVDVLPNSGPSREADRLLGTQGQEGITATSGENSLILSGEAATAAAAGDALVTTRAAMGKDGQIVDRLHVNGSVQVNLRVRIAEMSRTLTRELGVNWQSVNALGTSAVAGASFAAPIAAINAVQSSFSFLSRFKAAGRPVTLDTVIDALSEDQLIHVLAEPNLTTMSGEPASFLVGGEFPIPVASFDNNVTVEFKQYGVSLTFNPTVLSDGEISLHVRPEVSQLTTQGAVSISESNSVIQIPALTVRRADTTVELGSGQSFAIAGLLQDSTTQTGLGLPFLGDIPILGALFRSDSFQRNQTELVIVVTPYVVKPADNPSELKLPTDGWTPPNDLERILLLRQSGRGRSDAATTTAGPMRIPGDAGFMVE